MSFFTTIADEIASLIIPVISKEGDTDDNTQATINNNPVKFNMSDSFVTSQEILDTIKNLEDKKTSMSGLSSNLLKKI